MRNAHPLDFVSELLQETYSVINEIAEKHAILSVNQSGVVDRRQTMLTDR